MKKIQHIDRRQMARRNHLIRTNSDDFFTKLERIRLSTATAPSSRKLVVNDRENYL